MQKPVSKTVRMTVLSATVSVALVGWSVGLAMLFQPSPASAAMIRPVDGGSENTMQSQPAPVTSAATCTPQNPDEANTNIIFCGLVGSSTAELTADLKAYLDGTKTDPKHSDVQAFLQSQGLTDSMFTSGSWVMGETQKDSSNHGTLVVQGQAAGTNVTVFARCVETNQFCPGSNGAITPSNVLFFGNLSAMPTLVHMTNGTIDFAIWAICGNVITIAPTPIKESLTCNSLTANLKSQDDSRFTYTFTAQATAQNTQVSSFSFTFNDTDSTETVNTISNNGTTAVSASQDHTFTQTSSQQTFTAQAFVNGSTTSPACTAQVIIPAQPTPAPTVTTITTPAKPVAVATAVPTQLVNTGPGDVIGLFAVTSALGGLLHHFVLRKKLSV